MDGTLLERTLRHDRALVIGVLSLLVALSWGYLVLGLPGAGKDMPGMAGLELPASSAPAARDSMGMPMPGATISGSGMSVPMPGASISDPGMSTPMPGASISDPGMSTPMPGASISDSGMSTPMPAPPGLPAAAWPASRWLALLAMWLVMMAAMMLPGAAPMILLYSRIARCREEGSPTTGSGFFMLGYIAVWSLGSMAAVVLQYWLDRLALLSPAVSITSNALAGFLLIIAGAYQWMPWKQACLRRCRSPLDFLVTYWRSGSAGAFAMGIRHGAYCAGCCWLLMLLLFVGGVMNLYWVAGLASYVLVEKVFAGGAWISRVTGAALMGWGAAVLLAIA